MLSYQLKSYQNQDYYNKRDIIMKMQVINTFCIPNLSNFRLNFKQKENLSLIQLISLNILLFDRFPYLVKVKNTIDKKKINTIIGTTILLSYNSFLQFFFRLFYEDSLNSLKSKLMQLVIKGSLITTHLKLTNLEEFIFLYERFKTLPDLILTLEFVNCKKKEEKLFIINNLIKI